MEIMDGCATKDRCIHYWKVKKYIKVAYEVINTLEFWYRRGSSLAGETVKSIHKVRAGILINMKKFSKTSTEFSMVALLQVVDLSRDYMESISEGKFKYDIHFERSWSTVESFIGFWEPLYNNDVLDVESPVNNYPMGRLDDE